jgi:hypothetical protein
MDYEELEENLNLTIEELYNGLSNLANVTRSNPDPDDVADQFQRLADDICRHWPTCRAAHDLNSPEPEEF